MSPAVFSESATLDEVMATLLKTRGKDARDQAHLDWAYGVLGDLRAQARQGIHKNPGKDGGVLLSKRAYDLSYKHLEDGEDYQHDFAPGVSIFLASDKSVHLYRPDGKPLWEDFG